MSAILLISLLGAVSFGFVSRTVEYLVVSEAVEEISKYYKSIGYITAVSGDPHYADITPGVRLLQESEQIAVHDITKDCEGILNGVYNTDFGGFQSLYSNSNTAEFMFWGELVEKYFRSADPEKSLLEDTYTFKFRVTERIYGYPDYAPEGKYLILTYSPKEGNDALSKVFDSLEKNKVYGVRAYYQWRKGMVLRQAIPDGSWFLTEEESESVDSLIEADTVQEINRHKIMIEGTKDLSARPLMQESMRAFYLVDGRWLTLEDHENKNPACIVHEKFAEIRNLSVGDTLSITIADQEISEQFYYAADVKEEDLPQETTTVEFTIVGTYNSRLNDVYSSFDSVYIFVPDSCIPAAYMQDRTMLKDGALLEGDYSFILKSPELEAEFVQQYRGKLEAMGYELQMIENGWAGFSAVADPILQSTAYSAVMFGITQILTLFMAAFLYFRQQRREFAIGRALGIPGKKMICWKTLPILIIGIAGIGSGCIFGWNYSFKQVQKTLAALVDGGQQVATNLSAWILGGLFFASLFLLLMAVVGCFALLSHRPVLEILHGAQNHGRIAKRKNDELRISEKVSVITETVAENSAPVGSKTGEEKSSLRAALPENNGSGMREFVRKHLSRSRGSSMTVIAVSMIFLLTLGWIIQSIQQTEKNIDKLYERITVDVDIIQGGADLYIQKMGYIAGTLVDAVIDTGFVKESRLIAPDKEAYLSDVNEKEWFSGFTLLGVTDTEVLNEKERPGVVTVTGSGTERGEITYLEGWDDTLFTADYDENLDVYPIVVPDTILERFHVEPGEELFLEAGSGKVRAVIAGSYTGTFNSNDLRGMKGKAVLLPLSLMKRLSPGTLYYTTAEFTLDPEKNHELPVFRETAKKLIEEDRMSRCVVNFRIWDEELRMTAEPMEQNLRLMKILFPIAQLVAMLAGGMVSLLLLLQNAKTAAILRVLGIPAKTVRRMLGAEKLLLGIAGSVAGILLCAILGKWNMALLVNAALYLLGLLIGMVIGCAAVTRKKPLELLQVKE